MPHLLVNAPDIFAQQSEAEEREAEQEERDGEERERPLGFWADDEAAHREVDDENSREDRRSTMPATENNCRGRIGEPRHQIEVQA